MLINGILKINNMEREDGYYWVKISDTWYIIRYDGASWYDGMENLYNEKDLKEINEKRIRNPDEPMMLKVRYLTEFGSQTSVMEIDKLIPFMKRFKVVSQEII